MKSNLKTRCIAFLLLFAAATLLASSAFAIQTDEDPSLREFDQNMVATPAELYRLLTTLRPPAQQREMDAQRIKDLEKAGRQFLSKLTPEQQEKAWQFAEKYLRQNGVDSSTSKALMDEFGVPSEIQKELAKNFRNYQNANGTVPRDVDFSQLSKLLQKAKDRSLDSQSQSSASPFDIDPDSDSRQPEINSTEIGTANRNGTAQSNLQDRPLFEPRPRTQPGESNATDNRNLNRPLPAQIPGGVAGDENDPFKEPRFGEELNPKTSRANKQPNLADGKPAGSQNDADPFASDESENNRESSAGDPDFDWEKNIRELLQKTENEEMGRSGNPNSTNGFEIDPAERMRIQDALKQFNSGDTLNKELFQKPGEANPASKNVFESPLGRQFDRPSAAPKERLTKRFDRLIVDAAKRTLASDGSNFEMPGSMDNAFDNLIDRVHKSVVKNRQGADDANGWNQSSSTGPDRLDSPWRDSEFDQPNRNSGSSPDRNSENQSSSATASTPEFNSSTIGSPKISGPDFKPSDLLESLPDLSGINPKQVFTFFAIVGLVLMMAYFVLQNLVGDEVVVKSRRVGKLIRKAQIRSPKDLVETVDLFLINKFGSDSKWWNARHAQNILSSDSPDYSEKIRALITDYVQARYMRSELRLTDSEQQRYKQTLQELSKPAKG